MIDQDGILLSIVIPCYNAENTIEQCLDSLQNQIEGRNCEVICVDDGSQDETGKIIDCLAAKYKNLKVLHQKNTGVSAARNIGGGIARGQWITFVDSDDSIEPDSFINAVKIAEECHDCDLIVFDYYEKNDFNADIVCSDAFCEVKKYVDTVTYLEQLLNYNKMLTIHGLWNKFFSRDLFQKIRLQESVRLGEDALFNYEYLRQAKIICTSNNAYYIYNNYGKSSLSRGRTLTEVWKAYKAILQALEGTLKTYDIETLFPMVHMAYCLGTINLYIKTKTVKEDEQILLDVLHEIRRNKENVTVKGRFNQILVRVVRSGRMKFAVLLCNLKKART
jgi:glycosyltransferase EpsJ